MTMMVAVTVQVLETVLVFHFLTNVQESIQNYVILQ